MKPTIAVLGCGYWGQNHIKTLKQLDHLYAISDIDMVKAKELAKKYGILALNPEELFNKIEINAITLALPPQFHAEYAIKVIKSNKDVFIEKPISLNLDDAEKILKIAKENNKILMVGHILRFHSAFEELQKQVKIGTIGNIKYINAKRWGFGKFHIKSDALWDLAPHDLSLILALMQEEPKNVLINGTEILGNNFDYTNIEMNFLKAKAFLSVSRLSPYCERKFIVIGDKAIIIWDDMQEWDKKLAIYNYKINQDCSSGECTPPKYIAIQPTQPLTQELQHFIDCIKTRNCPRTNGSEGLAVLRILNMLHKG